MLVEFYRICTLCIRNQHIIENQRDYFRRQSLAAERMKQATREKLPEFEVGDCVTISVHSVDCGPLDFKSIFGVITDKKNGVYQVGINDGLIKGWFQCTALEHSTLQKLLITDVNKNILISEYCVSKQILNAIQEVTSQARAIIYRVLLID